MKFKKSTVLLFASALVLGTGVFIYVVTIAPQMAADKLERQKVFNFDMEDVKSLTVETPERKLEFVRVEAKTESVEPQWEMKVLDSATKSELNDRKPIPANEAYVSFLISLLMNAQSDRVIPISAEQKSEYGLDQPQATINFTLKNDNLYKLVLGKRDFSDNFLYAIANSPNNPNAKLSTLLLPINFENGVNRSLSEWKAESETTEQTKPTDPDSKRKEDQPSNPSTTEQKTLTPDSTLEEKSNETAKPKVENSEPSTPEATTEKTEPEKLDGESSTPSPPPQTGEEKSDLNTPPNEDATTPSEQPKPESSPSQPSEKESE